MIDQEGINSLNTGAGAITYEGTEGPKSPEQDQAMAMGIPEGLTVEEAIETFKASEGRDPNNIEEVIKFFKDMTLSKGPIFPSPEDPVNPFGPKPIGPPLPNRQMAAFGGIMGLDNRKQYGIGSKFKRAFNKVTRPFTKVAQKLMPKELAGVAQIAAPFLGPVYGPLAMAAGQAKQRGRINPLSLAIAMAPYAKFRGGSGIGQFKPTGYGSMGSGQSLRNLFLSGETRPDDMLFSPDNNPYYLNESGNPILYPGDKNLAQGADPIFGKYGKSADEFLFGKPTQTRKVTPRQDKYGISNERSPEELSEYFENLSPSEQLRLENLGPTDTGYASEIAKIKYRPNVTKTMYDSATRGILGAEGVVGNLASSEGLAALGKSKLAGRALGKDNELVSSVTGKLTPSMLKLGSWAIGIVSGIKAGKYADEMEAAQAAEDAALAADSEASEATLQAARDWATSTFGSMSVYADGGRIGFASGPPDPGMMQGLGGLKGQQKQNPNTKTIDMMPDIQILTGSENTIDAQQVFPNDIAIAIGDGTFVFNGLKFNSEEDLMEYMSKVMPFKADGGRINKNMGGEMDMGGISSLQTQASDVTPPGMELDLRGGGFIPIGTAEKADDVPARVSKNEFVFTADAVKAAGGGSVNEGAKKMYDTMKRLESQVG